MLSFRGVGAPAERMKLLTQTSARLTYARERMIRSRAAAGSPAVSRSRQPEAAVPAEPGLRHAEDAVADAGGNDRIEDLLGSEGSPGVLEGEPEDAAIGEQAGQGRERLVRVE